MKETSIQLDHLSIGYPSKHQQRVVAEDINASLYQGELTCLIGPNGIGKSTLLRTLAAFQPPLAGSILLNDGKQLLSHYTPQEIARLISIVLTNKTDAQKLSVNELIGLGRSPYTGFWGKLSATDQQLVDEAMQLVGITHLAQRKVSTLSDGERQKTMIAKALAQQTPIILLDEPTAFLDYPSKVETLQMLRRLAHQLHKTIFLSTHDVELALQIADQIWLMQPEDTQRLSMGSPRELAANGTLSHFLDRDGIQFDPATLTIHIQKDINL